MITIIVVSGGYARHHGRRTIVAHHLSRKERSHVEEALLQLATKPRIVAARRRHVDRGRAENRPHPSSCPSPPGSRRTSSITDEAVDKPGDERGAAIDDDTHDVLRVGVQERSAGGVHDVVVGHVRISRCRRGIEE